MEYSIVELLIVLVPVTFFAIIASLAEVKAKQGAIDVKNNEAIRRETTISQAREKAENLAKRGSIFEITTNSFVQGYHIKDLGWVSCDCEERSAAENRLKLLAAERYPSANVLTKLWYSVRNERYQAGTGPKGNPYYKNRSVKSWEAQACQAIPNREVDKPPVRWNDREAVVDGSNVAFWGNNDRARIEAVKCIVHLLKAEGVQPIVVFDANIGFKLAGRYMDASELTAELGSDVVVEIVPSGTIADHRVIELAEERRAVIVSNDLYRESLRARPIPKRRGFFLLDYNYGELTSTNLTHGQRDHRSWTQSSESRRPQQGDNGHNSSPDFDDEIPF